MSFDDRQRWCKAVLQQNQQVTSPQPQQQTRSSGSHPRPIQASEAIDPRWKVLDARLLADDPNILPAISSPSPSSQQQQHQQRSPQVYLEVSSHRNNTNSNTNTPKRQDEAALSPPGASTHFVSDAKRFPSSMGTTSLSRAEHVRRMKKIQAQNMFSGAAARAGTPQPGGIGTSLERLRQQEEQQRSVSPAVALFVSPLRMGSSGCGPMVEQQQQGGRSTPSPGWAGRSGKLFLQSRRPKQQQQQQSPDRATSLPPLSSPPATTVASNHQEGAGVLSSVVSPPHQHHHPQQQEQDGNGQPLPHFMQPLREAQLKYEMHEQFLQHRALASTPLSVFGQSKGHKIAPTPQQLEWCRPFMEHPHSRAVHAVVNGANAKRNALLKQAQRELAEALEEDKKKKKTDLAVKPVVSQASLAAASQQQSQQQQQQQPHRQDDGGGLIELDLEATG